MATVNMMLCFPHKNNDSQCPPGCVWFPSFVNDTAVQCSPDCVRFTLPIKNTGILCPHQRGCFPLPDNDTVIPCPPSCDVTPIYEARKDNGWNGAMVVAAIATVFTVFIVTVIAYYVYFRLYSNRLRRRRGIRRTRQFSWRAAEYFQATSRDQGLCSAEVEALPVFVYKPENLEEGIRCAVCLCEFEEDEKGRMLPNCNHSFHLDCIDMWFYSHSTCPLCRATVQAPRPESGRREVEISIREAADVQPSDEAEEKEKTSISSSGQQGERTDGDESKDVEEGSGASTHIAITLDIAARDISESERKEKNCTHK
uniref:RING-type E3 ubiquitin transferase n=1 Tax=Araucaria cunninghamii TaxID=56994 RepID=A0A0D6QRH1_ARACU